MKVLLNDRDVHIVHRNPGYPFINYDFQQEYTGTFTTTTTSADDLNLYINHNDYLVAPDREFSYADSTS